MEDVGKLNALFQSLGDANRLKIIKFIGAQERSVSEIVDDSGLSQPLVSHHLKTLKTNKIVATKRKGPFVMYQLSDNRLLEALGILLDIAHTMDATPTQKPMFACPPWWIKRQKRKGDQ